MLKKYLIVCVVIYQIISINAEPTRIIMMGSAGKTVVQNLELGGDDEKSKCEVIIGDESRLFVKRFTVGESSQMCTLMVGANNRIRLPDLYDGHLVIFVGEGNQINDVPVSRGHYKYTDSDFKKF